MTVDVDFTAKLSAKIGELVDAVERDRSERRRQAFMAEAQRFVRLHGSVALDSNGFGVIAFDNRGPDQGWYWYVRRLAVGGATPSTTVSGRADVFVSSSDYRRYTTLAQMGLQDWQDQAVSLPLVGTYSDGELELRMNERLFVVVSGGTSGQVVTCVGTAKQMQEAASEQSVVG